MTNKILEPENLLIDCYHNILSKFNHEVVEVSKDHVLMSTMPVKPAAIGVVWDRACRAATLWGLPAPTNFKVEPILIDAPDRDSVEITWRQCYRRAHRQNRLPM